MESNWNALILQNWLLYINKKVKTEGVPKCPNPSWGSRLSKLAKAENMTNKTCSIVTILWGLECEYCKINLECLKCITSGETTSDVLSHERLISNTHTRDRAGLALLFNKIHQEINFYLVKEYILILFPKIVKSQTIRYCNTCTCAGIGTTEIQ